jgi:hypothetical protein
MNREMYETWSLGLCLACLEFFWCKYAVRLIFKHEIRSHFLDGNHIKG